MNRNSLRNLCKKVTLRDHDEEKNRKQCLLNVFLQPYAAEFKSVPRDFANTAEPRIILLRLLFTVIISSLKGLGAKVCWIIWRGPARDATIINTPKRMHTIRKQDEESHFSTLASSNGIAIFGGVMTFYLLLDARKWTERQLRL